MNNLVVRHFPALQDYQKTWDAMRQFTQERNADTPDEIWLLQHPAVFTLGQAGKKEHLHDTGTIPLVNSDRGGQITYHGPGQLLAYMLLDLKRRQLNVRQLVSILETSLIALLAEYHIESYAKKEAPGVYLQNKGKECKIAALGLRVKRGCSYHGLSLNIDMDLTPFTLINPCGYAGLTVTHLAEHLQPLPNWKELEDRLLFQLKKHLH